MNTPEQIAYSELQEGSDTPHLRILMGHGRVEVGDAVHEGLPALWFGQANKPAAPLTLDEVRNLSSMQAGVPWTDDLVQALAECIKLYEQCADAGIRPFDPSDLTPQQHDAFWEHGELPWHGTAARPA